MNNDNTITAVVSSDLCIVLYVLAGKVSNYNLRKNGKYS
jgi:hypothetical protein